MKTVLLALSSAAREGGAPAAAVGRAKALEAGLLVAYVVDSRTIDGLERRVSGQGFVGERPCAELMSEAVQEWRRCAQASLAEVVKAADEAGVRCEGQLVEGDWVELIASLIERSETEGVAIAECIAPDFAGSPLRKLLRTDDLARLKARVSCPVVSAP